MCGLTEVDLWRCVFYLAEDGERGGVRGGDALGGEEEEGGDQRPRVPAHDGHVTACDGP